MKSEEYLMCIMCTFIIIAFIILILYRDHATDQIRILDIGLIQPDKTVN